MPDRLPAAVLWDLDGTLVDTEPYWMAEEYALVDEFGGGWTPEHALALVGLALHDSAAYLMEHSQVPLGRDQVVARLLAGVGRRLREQGVPWRPGALELLAALRARGVATALVTMSHRVLTDVVEAALAPGSFDVVVTGEQVTRGKPDPEAYAVAAARLGVDPARCVAIEDSPTGARSAVAAGIPTLVVPHTLAVPALAGSAQVSSLRGVRPQDLLRLCGRPVPVG